MNAFSGEDMGVDLRHQRHQRRRCRAHPVGERRYLEINAFPCIDGALAVERQMQAVLGEQDMGEQLRPRPPARDRVRRSGRLGDRFAGSAGELLADMLDHFPLARNELQRLGYVLADLAQCRSAATRADRQRRIDGALARQMLREGTASRSAPFERRHHHLLARRHGCDLRQHLGLRSIRLQIGELKLELIEQRTTLRGLAEPIVPQLPDRELELLDQQRPVLGLALRRRGAYLGRTQRLALRDDERMRTRKVGRKRIIDAHRQ